MREPRNPFRLLASEHIETDSTFLRLFGPGVLEVLPGISEPWKKVRIIRSAPGGGKTSLLRLFTPSVLTTLHSCRSAEEYQELYKHMNALGVVDDSGPRLLGVMLTCARNYAALTDLELEESQKDRLLFSLLDARLALATLRSVSVLRRLDYPKDLANILIKPKSHDSLGTQLQFPCDGMTLYEWARKTEANVCEIIDSLALSSKTSIPGHETLASLELLSPDSLLLNGKPLTDEILFMFDDVHKLTHKQRHRLIQTAIEARSPVAVWIAERYEALSPEEMLASGALDRRDYDGIILLEDYWRSKAKRFEHLVLNIADRRARSATDTEIGSFASSIEVSLDSAEWQQKHFDAIKVVSSRILSAAGTDPRYQDWIKSREVEKGTPWERLIARRVLEILIERERRKSQRTFGFPLRREDLDEKDDSDVRGAAELFVSREFSLPYYYGPSRLAYLASSNIEQFLWLAGEEFEEVVSAAVLQGPAQLNPFRQHSILKKAVRSRWDDIPRRVTNGREVRNFLEAVGQFAKWMTYQPNAPYSPGVTGIGILMRDRQILINETASNTSSEYARLGRVLSAALAHNLLEAELDYKCKGSYWMVLYLNRFLCVRFDLPLTRGGWKERSLKELLLWLTEGFKTSKNKRALV